MLRFELNRSDYAVGSPPVTATATATGTRQTPLRWLGRRIDVDNCLLSGANAGHGGRHHTRVSRLPHLLRLASDGDAAAAEEESAFAPVVPKYAVVDSFAGPQHLKDLFLPRSLPNPPRLENHPISDLALNQRRTSLKCRLSSRAWYLSVWTQSEGNDRQRAGRIGQE